MAILADVSVWQSSLHHDCYKIGFDIHFLQLVLVLTFPCFLICGSNMILGQVSYTDIFVFLLFLAPQLIFHVGLIGTLVCGLQALPFLLVRLPIEFLYERFVLSRKKQSPFVRQASLFEDFVIRCVRYAFANIPASVGRVFFSRPVALPFLRFRMLRHGYFRSPIRWHEVSLGNAKGIWILSDRDRKPDIVVYYAHGGGFSMGSSYFYLEFLLVWHTLLKISGFNNPAIFALEYTLVPDACYPTQLQQTMAGYKHVLSTVQDSSKVCVSGDSAGALLILSLLLHLAHTSDDEIHMDSIRPGMAILISPWVTLVSPKDKNTPSDYLDANSLHLYAHQYAGKKVAINDAFVSPGNCKDVDLWRQASPSKGFGFLFGAEEVFAPEIRDLLTLIRKTGANLEIREEEGGIHAWPVATLFLGGTNEGRQKGLKTIVHMITECMTKAAG